MEKGDPVDVFYLDFQKAFDKIPHQRNTVKFLSAVVRAESNVHLASVVIAPACIKDPVLYAQKMFPYMEERETYHAVTNVVRSFCVVLMSELRYRQSLEYYQTTSRRKKYINHFLQYQMLSSAFLGTRAV